MSKQKDFSSFQVDDGWIIIFNSLNVFTPFDGTTVFGAVNPINGQEITVEYIDDVEGYTLSIINKQRANGSWSIGELETNNNELLRSCNVEEVVLALRLLLNPLKKNLNFLKLYGGWSICKNNIQTSIESYKEFELVFFATKNKYFIDITFHKKNINPLKVCIGLSRTKFEGISYEARNPHQVLNFEFQNIGMIAEFIENYFMEPSVYFKILG